jgi:predicted RNA binding protein YcfA (HicA-like mRNA interferase family)
MKDKETILVGIHMSDKIQELIESLNENNIEKCNSILDEMIKEKISLRLQEKKIEIASSILEGDIKVFNKKQKKRIARHLGSIARKEGDPVRSITAVGRKMLSTMHPEKVKKILATEGVRPATIKFSDAHRHLTGIGYDLIRQSGSSHKVYKRKGSKDIILAPHGKDVSAPSTRDVYNALKAHTNLKEQNEPYKQSPVVRASLLHIRREKVKEHDPKQYKKELKKLDSV